ncbi:MAG TPA: hypothetical protein VLV16_05725 [Gemmatimonadales bacterium]|nr:hypothetical protein [Gemmatimonadales bacterium]
MRSVVMQIVLILGAVLVLTQPADAQRRRRATPNAPASPGRLEIGGHFGYSFDFDQTLVGAQLALPIARQLDLYPSLDWYSGSGSPDWGLNLDLRIRPPRLSQTWYLGSGVNLLWADGLSGDHTTNFNVEGGLETRSGSVRPYFELRMIVGDGTALQLVGGAYFGKR